MSSFGRHGVDGFRLPVRIQRTTPLPIALSHSLATGRLIGFRGHGKHRKPLEHLLSGFPLRTKEQSTNVPYTIEPKQLALPDEPYYDIKELRLFDYHDRASWERAFKEQAPPFDNTRPRKPWADTSVLKGVSDPDNTHVEYDYFDYSSRTFKKMRLTVREASTPNLPGDYIYPAYVVSPTPAVIINPDGGESTFNARMLCYRIEAEQLAGELGAVSVVENTFDGVQFRVDWRGEQRRIWVLRIGGSYYSAALLLQRKYRNGVGYPGRWGFEDNGQPIWMLEPPDTGIKDPRPEVPVPCRPLDPKEALYLGHPMKVIVYRKDKPSEFNQAEGASPAAFPPDLRSILERIDANLQQLLALQFTDRS